MYALHFLGGSAREGDGVAARLSRLWQEAGAADIRALGPVARTLATCRMARDGDSAAVDPFGQSFEVPTLWICDGSTSPSSLAANPALTIMALSLRSAGHCLQA